jgi:sigma-B regulation protein RsbU (phosphoserine phosphatase)
MSRLEEAFVRELLRTGKSRMIYDLRRELDLTGPEFPDSFLCAVMKTENAVYGALCIGRMPGQDIFTAGDLKLSRVLSSTAAVALENSLLHRQRLEEEERMIRLQEEFRLARSIQNNLLPKKSPILAGYDIAGGTIPARSVGGDYYDFIPMTDARLALCLGDVSGKGMPAALLMAHLQAAVRGQTLLHVAPRECLGHSNILLYHSTDLDRFATCFYGILDADEHCLCYANAGHEHPLLFRGNGHRESLDKGGIVLGILEESDYSEATVPVEAGDLILIYSDGITDAADGSEEEYGLDRLEELVRENRKLPARELVSRIMHEVQRHAGDTPQTDDMTLVVIRRND